MKVTERQEGRERHKAERGVGEWTGTGKQGKVPYDPLDNSPRLAGLTFALLIFRLHKLGI